MSTPQECNGRKSSRLQLSAANLCIFILNFPPLMIAQRDRHLFKWATISVDFTLAQQKSDGQSRWTQFLEKKKGES